MNASCSVCHKDLGPFEPFADPRILPVWFCESCRDNREKAMGRPDRLLVIRRYPAP